MSNGNYEQKTNDDKNCNDMQMIKACESVWCNKTQRLLSTLAAIKQDEQAFLIHKQTQIWMGDNMICNVMFLSDLINNMKSEKTCFLTKRRCVTVWRVVCKYFKSNPIL